MGNDGYSGLTGLGMWASNWGDFQKLVVVLHTNHAVLSGQGVVESVLSSESGGMGTGSLGPQVGAAYLDEDDGLSALGGQLGQLDELAAVFEPLDEPGDDSGVIVVEEIPGEVGEIQVGFVAGGSNVAEPTPVIHSPDQEGAKGRCAALAHQPNGAAQARRAARDELGPDVMLQVGDAKAVGAAYPQARLAGEGPQFLL